MSKLQSETSEDLIDMDEHRLVVEAGFDLFFIQILSDIFILAKIFVEIFAPEASVSSHFSVPSDMRCRGKRLSLRERGGRAGCR